MATPHIPSVKKPLVESLTERPSRRSQRAVSTHRALLVAIALLAALHAGVLAYHLGVTLAFPYDLNYGEGYVLNDAARLSRGESLYVDLQQFPMVGSPSLPL